MRFIYTLPFLKVYIPGRADSGHLLDTSGMGGIHPAISLLDHDIQGDRTRGVFRLYQEKSALYSRGLIQVRFKLKLRTASANHFNAVITPTCYRLSVAWGGFPLVSSAIKDSDRVVPDKPDPGARGNY